MKKRCTHGICLLFLSLSLTSCYVNRFDIGKGAQSTVEVHQQNHYLIDGLVIVKK